MADIQLKSLIEAGVHFGSRTSLWNPAMAPYIRGKQNGIHIIDLRETVKGMVRTSSFLRKIASEGKKVLFVGTKRHAAPVVRDEALRCRCHFVAHRWLGGSLTNMGTMRQRVIRLQELESLESSGEIHNFSKKMVSSLTRERKKIGRNFEGIRDMTKLPGALIVVDPVYEHIAMAEAMKLEIPTIGIVDTDSNPKDVDFAIPANDDSIRSLQYVLSTLTESILDGASQAGTQAVMAARAAGRIVEDAVAEEKMQVPENLRDMGSFSYGGNE